MRLYGSLFRVVKRSGDNGGSGYQVTAAARMLEILDVMAAHGVPMTLAEIARASGVPRPTTYRLLRTLQDKAWVNHDGVGYRLGFKCFELGAAAGSGHEVRTQALPHLVELRDRLRVTVQVAKLEDWRVIYLERVLARDTPSFIQSRAGAILPAHCTGVGKVLLAHRNLEDVATWADREGLPGFTSRTITAVPALLAELYAIRERGYATEEGERHEDARCIAAPIHNQSGDVVAALSASGHRSRMPEPLLGSGMASEVVASAKHISSLLSEMPLRRG